MRRAALVLLLDLIVQAYTTEVQDLTAGITNVKLDPADEELLASSTPDPLAKEREDLEGSPLDAAAAAGDAMKKQAGRLEITEEQAKEIMNNPEAQGQIQGMQALMQSDEFMAKMKSLQDDPMVKDMVEDIRKTMQEKGMAGMQESMRKYYNNRDFLKKMSAAVGDLPAKVMEKAGIDQKHINAATGHGSNAGQPEKVPEFLLAAKKGELKDIKRHVEDGTDPSMSDSEGRTALHFAAGTGQDLVVEFLVNSGANLLAVDGAGNTPLHYAAGYGRGPACKVLLDAGASPSAVNQAGQTPKAVAELNPTNELLKNKALMGRLSEQGLDGIGPGAGLLAEDSSGSRRCSFVAAGFLCVAAAGAFVAGVLRPRSRQRSAQEPFLDAV